MRRPWPLRACWAKNRQTSKLTTLLFSRYFIPIHTLAKYLSTILKTCFHGLISLQIIPRFTKQFLTLYTTPMTNARPHQPAIGSYPQLLTSGNIHPLPPSHTNIPTSLPLDMSSITNTKTTKRYALVSGKMLPPSSG